MNNKPTEKRKRNENLSPLKKHRTVEEEINDTNGHFEQNEDFMNEEEYYNEELEDVSKLTQKNLLDKDFYNGN